MIIAILILVVFGLCLYGMDCDLRRLRDRAAADEIGAGGFCDEEGLPGLSPLAGLTATLATESLVAGADTPFDWDSVA